jgi:hypothetical protein
MLIDNSNVGPLMDQHARSLAALPGIRLAPGVASSLDAGW